MRRAAHACSRRPTPAPHGVALASRHPAPDVSRFDYLVEAAAGRGVRLDPSSSKALAQSLDAATVRGALCTPSGARRWAPLMRATVPGGRAACAGPGRAGVQSPAAHPLHALHDPGRVHLLGRARVRGVLALRPRLPHLHALYLAHPPLRRYVLRPTPRGAGLKGGEGRVTMPHPPSTLLAPARQT